MVGKKRDFRKYRIRGKIWLRVFTDVNCRLGVVVYPLAGITDKMPKAASGLKKILLKSI